ncbi:hypothetical protein G443_004252 [Actinoalloteichus cyanogriseus DSM 43889]|uniref:Secreted protein n=1 Tax=Actinoalloteichus caeruleus DSM 43889 TaxID=1120930 RepID=A0ABT1JN75_ACTCY|nr:hypothetical protein [Actinoalloteichus caeruleus DSM 43889]
MGSVSAAAWMPVSGRSAAASMAPRAAHRRDFVLATLVSFVRDAVWTNLRQGVAVRHQEHQTDGPHANDRPNRGNPKRLHNYLR